MPAAANADVRKRPPHKRRDDTEPERQLMEPPGRGRNVGIVDVADRYPLPLEANQEFEVFGQTNVFPQPA